MRESEMILVSLLAFFVVLGAALLFSSLLRRFSIPWAVALILGGVAVGPYGAGLVEINDTVLFLAEIGVIFLMFIAGMETSISAIKRVWRDGLTVAVASGLIPSIVGLAIGFGFGYGWEVALILAVIFMSSSFAVVIPTLEEKGILHSKLGRVVVSSTMIQDIASLLLLAIMLQFISPDAWVPLPILLGAMAAALVAGIFARKHIAQIRQWWEDRRQHSSHEFALFEQELSLVIIIMVGMAFIFEALKMETIVGAFFAGLIISELTKSKVLEYKIHILGYGVFIPIFFVVIGAWVDVNVFTEELWTILPLALTILLGSSVSKFASGWIAGRALGYSSKESAIIGATSVPQLITTLAVLLVGQNLGILSPELVAAIVVLSIATVIISPSITNRLLSSGLPPAAEENTE